MRIAFVPIVVNDKKVIGAATNYRTRVRIVGKRINGPDGKVYMRFDPIQMKIIPGDFDLKLVDLFANSPTLEAIGKVFVAENKQYFASEVHPALEKSLSNHFTLAANEIVKRSTLDELFP
jgi:hypothetical protein